MNDAAQQESTYNNKYTSLFFKGIFFLQSQRLPQTHAETFSPFSLHTHERAQLRKCNRIDDILKYRKCVSKIPMYVAMHTKNNCKGTFYMRATKTVVGSGNLYSFKNRAR